MPLPPSTASRRKRHTRTITLDGYQRDDGKWEIEGAVTDVKTFHAKNRFIDRQPGEHHHHMEVRLVVDLKGEVHDVDVVSDANPHGETCRKSEPDYKRLIGLNLKRGFRKGVKERMGGVNGCTHVNELLGIMPTAFFQSIAGTVQTTEDEERMSMVFDTCTSWDRSGPRVREHYPRWYIAERKSGDGKGTEPQ